MYKDKSSVQHFLPSIIILATDYPIIYNRHLYDQGKELPIQHTGESSTILYTQETLGAQTKLHIQNVSNQQDEDQHFSELYFYETGEQN